MRKFIQCEKVLFILCIMMALSAISTPAGMETVPLSAELSLDREYLLINQRVEAALNIQGGHPPYTVSYQWIVYGDYATGDSRPVFYQEGRTQDKRFSDLIDASGDGQLEVEITDNKGDVVYVSGGFAVYEPGQYTDDQAALILQGKWQDIGEDALQGFSMVISSDGRIQMKAVHPIWLGGYETLTGKVSFEGNHLHVLTDKGEKISYRYHLRIEDRQCAMELEMPDGTSVLLDYSPFDASSLVPETLDSTPMPGISDAHKTLLGEWKGRGEDDEQIQLYLLLSEDGRLTFENQNASNPQFDTRITGLVTQVGEEAISYITDSGYSGNLLYWPIGDGKSMRMAYQDIYGIMTRVD